MLPLDSNRLIGDIQPNTRCSIISVEKPKNIAVPTRVLSREGIHCSSVKLSTYGSFVSISSVFLVEEATMMRRVKNISETKKIS